MQWVKSVAQIPAPHRYRLQTPGLRGCWWAATAWPFGSRAAGNGDEEVTLWHRWHWLNVYLKKNNHKTHSTSLQLENNKGFQHLICCAWVSAEQQTNLTPPVQALVHPHRAAGWGQRSIQNIIPVCLVSHSTAFELEGIKSEEEEEEFRVQ